MTESRKDPPGPTSLSPSDVEAAVADLKRELQAAAQGGAPQRIECSPESVEQGLARLVLGLIELLRRLLERQAIRRLEGGSLSDAQIEEMGKTLMLLEQKVAELAASFGLRPEDLNIDLGPLGKTLDR